MIVESLLSLPSGVPENHMAGFYEITLTETYILLSKQWFSNVTLHENSQIACQSKFLVPVADSVDLEFGPGIQDLT